MSSYGSLGHTAIRPHGHTAFSPVCVGRYETKCSGSGLRSVGPGPSSAGLGSVGLRRYKTKCSSSVPISYTATYKTSCTPMEDYELEYLDRQNVACGRNQVKLPANGPYFYTHMSVHILTTFQAVYTHVSAHISTHFKLPSNGLCPMAYSNRWQPSPAVVQGHKRWLQSRERHAVHTHGPKCQHMALRYQQRTAVVLRHGYWRYLVMALSSYDPI